MFKKALNKTYHILSQSSKAMNLAEETISSAVRVVCRIDCDILVCGVFGKQGRDDRQPHYTLGKVSPSRDDKHWP